MPGFLICFHVPANTGYAIEPLELVFFDVIADIAGSKDKVHLGYHGYDNGQPRWLEEKDRLLDLHYASMTSTKTEELAAYIRDNNIEHVLALDLPVGAMIFKAFRKGGIKKVISYYGAPMSSINEGLKLLLKRIQVKCTIGKPDHFIFESYGMQRTATHGRGVNISNTSVVRLGIDLEKISLSTDISYVYKTFQIPDNRKIIIYMGHMEKRKGVDVLVKAIAILVNNKLRDDVHLLICGNQAGEETVFDELYKGTKADDFITFAGYRNDIPELMAGCYAAVIASTGWDSFPRSSLEIAAAGLPLLVSDLAGLNETVEPEVTGQCFSTGNYNELADKLENLIEDTALREKFSKNAAERVRNRFTLDIQKDALRKVIQNVIG